MDPVFYNDFIVEAKELLDQIEDNVLKLETTDSWDSCINKIFQGLHSLKGASGMMGIDNLQEHMHRVEDVFEGMKSDNTKMIRNVDYFLKSVDHARGILEGKKVKFNYTEENALPVDKVKKEVAPKPASVNQLSQSDSREVVELMALLEKSYHLLLYQFVDLDRYLAENNKDSVRNTLKKEIREISIALEKHKARQ